MASARASGGVPIQPRMVGDANHPTMAISTDSPTKKLVAVPMTRLTSAGSRAPIACATRMLAAMPTPKIAPIINIITMLALPSAVIAASPRVWLTQI